MTELAPLHAGNVEPVSTTLEVGVVICAYTLGRWDDLQSAVTSVLAQQPPVREIIVVVDHNPELLERARGLWPQPEPALSEDPTSRSQGQPGREPLVVVGANTGRRGLSGARNTGVALVSCQIVAFLDDDAAAEACWIGRLLAAYSDSRVLACGGAAIPELASTRPRWWPMEFDWIVGCSYVGLPTELSPVRNLIGANMSVRRAALVELGGFAEGIGRVGTSPVGCEETDLFIRMAQRWPSSLVIYEPSARVRHKVPADRLSWRYFGRRCFAEGRSKAMVAGRVGSDRALASERDYVLRVLPRGVARGLSGAYRSEDGAGLRAMAITAGLITTAAGYARGRRGSPLDRAPSTAVLPE